MNKSKILLIGCGKAGNKLVNEMMCKDARYTGLFVNTAYGDMANLKKFSEDRAFLFSGADGSGRNRNIAKDYVKNQIQALVDTVTSYPMHDVITVFTSADGGTGSGMTPMLLQMLYHTYKTKKLDRKINLVAIMPDYDNDDKISFENSIEFWNEIMKIKDECINDIKFVDNSKGNGFADINERVVTELNNSYSMNGVSDDGDIDDKDAKVFNTEKGFGLILSLKDGHENAQDAIDEAIKSSIFALPNSYDCNYIGISLKPDSYSLKDVRSCFDVIYKTTYRTYNNKHNTIVLSGTDTPSEIIEMIKAKLDDIETRSSNRATSKNVIIDVKEPVNKKNDNNSGTATFTEDELEDISAKLLNIFG